MSERTFTIFSGIKHDGEWPPKNLMEFSHWLAKKIASIPEPHRGSATIEFGTKHIGGGDHDVTMEITYGQSLASETTEENDVPVLDIISSLPPC
jgi:hypothetical protein